MGAPMLPGSPEEFVSAAEQVMAATGKPIAEMAGQAGTVRPLTAFIFQLGGALADEEGNPTINTPEALEALNYILALQSSGAITRPVQRDQQRDRGRELRQWRERRPD